MDLLQYYTTWVVRMNMSREKQVSGGDGAGESWDTTWVVLAVDQLIMHNNAGGGESGGCSATHWRGLLV
jgi:hypothetical protein